MSNFEQKHARPQSFPQIVSMTWWLMVASFVFVYLWIYALSVLGLISTANEGLDSKNDEPVINQLPKWPKCLSGLNPGLLNENRFPSKTVQQKYPKINMFLSSKPSEGRTPAKQLSRGSQRLAFSGAPITRMLRRSSRIKCPPQGQERCNRLLSGRSAAKSWRTKHGMVPSKMTWSTYEVK